MRSVIKSANKSGISSIVNQQFEVGKQILNAGLIPIIEPEVDINSPDKRECETLLLDSIAENLEGLEEAQSIMLKLTLPEEDNFYDGLINDQRVLRVVALSRGIRGLNQIIGLEETLEWLQVLFLALTEGLSAQQADEDFDDLPISDSEHL